jgi:hypothetical protein
MEMSSDMDDDVDLPQLYIEEKTMKQDLSSSVNPTFRGDGGRAV